MNQSGSAASFGGICSIVVSDSPVAGAAQRGLSTATPRRRDGIPVLRYQAVASGIMSHRRLPADLPQAQPHAAGSSRLPSLSSCSAAARGSLRACAGSPAPPARAERLSAQLAGNLTSIGISRSITASSWPCSASARPAGLVLYGGRRRSCSPRTGGTRDQASSASTRLSQINASSTG